MPNANDLASVILSRAGQFTDAMKLQKLLYYTQAWHLAITGKPLFTAPVEAWRQGPVVRAVWTARKERPTRRAASQNVAAVELGPQVSALIDLIISQYGSMSGDELSALTHEERPWLDARGSLPPDAPSDVEISREAMAAFYRQDRSLGGRTASDLAVGGIYVEGRDIEIDYEALLSEIDDDLPEDAWGGADLHHPVPVPAGRQAASDRLDA